MSRATSGKSKLLLLGILVLALAIVGGGATAWLLMRQHTATDTASKAKAEKVLPQVVFYELEPFTVNLKGGSYGDRLLYVHITLQLGDKATEEYFQKHLPQVRNRLLMVLSDQDADALVTSTGKHHLAQLVRAALNKPFADDHAELSVADVLFTQFIVQ